LTNLIKNAIKFTEKGQIEIGCIYEDSSLFKFYVKDTGKGISKDKVNDIFERFVQEDISLTRGHEGSGLGLAITKAYVEALGGEIWVDSEPQKGSCFYFTIADFNEKNKNSFANKTKVMDNPPQNLFSKDTKILIVEDDKASMLFIEAVLNSYNCEILKCENGLEAINICKSNADIDIIIMDIKIPIMDGYTATRKIRKFNKDVIIIAQTAYALLGEERKALDAGCNDYLAKPIQKNDLLNILHKYF
jgi:CheY-like chemotaxis protein